MRQGVSFTQLLVWSFFFFSPPFMLSQRWQGLCFQGSCPLEWLQGRKTLCLLWSFLKTHLLNDIYAIHFFLRLCNLIGFNLVLRSLGCMKGLLHYKIACLKINVKIKIIRIKEMECIRLLCSLMTNYVRWICWRGLCTNQNSNKSCSMQDAVTVPLYSSSRF